MEWWSGHCQAQLSARSASSSPGRLLCLQGHRPCQATHCLVRLHPDAPGTHPTIHSCNLYQVLAVTEGNKYLRAQQASPYPWAVQQEEIPLNRQVPRGCKDHTSPQAPRLEESTMSSSQVIIKATWVATGSPSSALAQVILVPCHTFQPQRHRIREALAAGGVQQTWLPLRPTQASDPPAVSDPAGLRHQQSLYPHNN